MNTQLWINDPTLLMNKNHIMELWPSPSMTTEEKINAITRLIIILSLLGYLITMSPRILMIGFITLGILIGLYYLQQNIQEKTLKEQFVNNRLNNNLLPEVYPSFTDPKTFTKFKDKLSTPTQNNPLMNVLIPEIQYNPNRKSAAPAFNPQVEEKINEAVKENTIKQFDDKNIDERLFKDLGDAFVFDRSMHQWYSMPATTVPNNREGFQEWLYGSMISGKEGNPLALERNHGGAYNYTMY
ncbi:MAG: hypothetical protein ACYSOT_04175 [Planctomycetota bacterium]|jgi:hypothetical protein